MSDKSISTIGSGNVYADLGLPDTDEYMAKSELAVRIFKIVKARRMTQTEAARLLGISQPHVSALLNGRLEGFSADRLFRFLTTLGCDVKIIISRPHAKTHGHVSVAAR